VIYLNKLMPLEGGLYQWAKFGFNKFAGFMVAWNLWLLAICVMALMGLVVTTNLSYAIGERAAWMPRADGCFDDQHRAYGLTRPGLDSRTSLWQMDPQRRSLVTTSDLRRAHYPSFRQPGPRRS